MKPALRDGIVLGLAGIMLLLATPGPALADHLSGGSPDIVGFWGGVALPLMFLGLCGWLGLAPERLKPLARKLGPWALLVGTVIMLVGGFMAAQVPKADVAGGPAWSRLAMRQFVGTFGVFAIGSALLMVLAHRRGFLSMGEHVKYVVFRNGDPNDPGAAKPKIAKHNRIGWIPVALMLLVSLFMVGGVLWVMMLTS